MGCTVRLPSRIRVDFIWGNLGHDSDYFSNVWVSDSWIRYCNTLYKHLLYYILREDMDASENVPR
jgi:hypothetical protein